jgi:hypothetical protein
MKIIFTILLLSLFATNVNAYTDVKKTYKLVIACIDINSNDGVSKTLRDKCIEKVSNVINKRYGYDVDRKIYIDNIDKYFRE